MADDDGEEAERYVEDLGEGVADRDAGDDAGRAIGRITRKEIVSRPKKRWRATASAASVPRTRAITVANSPAFSEVKKASRAASSLNAWLNQWVVQPGGGHSRIRLELKA